MPGAPFQQILSVYQNGLAKNGAMAVNLFSGGALSRMSVFGLRPHTLHCSSDHLPDDAVELFHLLASLLKMVRAASVIDCIFASMEGVLRRENFLVVFTMLVGAIIIM